MREWKTLAELMRSLILRATQQAEAQDRLRRLPAARRARGRAQD